MTHPRESVFGPIKDEHYVTNAVVHWLARAVPTWMSEVERQKVARGDFDGIPGLDVANPAGIITRPASYAQRQDLATLPEDALPLVMVVRAGTTDDPVKRGAKYEVTYGVGVAVVTPASDFYSGYVVSSTYEAAVRAAMLQHGSLDREDLDVKKWVSSIPVTLPISQQRTLRAELLSFAVTLHDALDITGGPMQPLPSQDHTDRINKGIANTVHINLTKQGLED
jgi:hypothetical protein